MPTTTPTVALQLTAAVLELPGAVREPTGSALYPISAALETTGAPPVPHGDVQERTGEALKARQPAENADSLRGSRSGPQALYLRGLGCGFSRPVVNSHVPLLTIISLHATPSATPSAHPLRPAHGQSWWNLPWKNFTFKFFAKYRSKMRWKKSTLFSTFDGEKFHRGGRGGHSFFSPCQAVMVKNETVFSPCQAVMVKKRW